MVIVFTSAEDEHHDERLIPCRGEATRYESRQSKVTMTGDGSLVRAVVIHVIPQLLDWFNGYAAKQTRFIAPVASC